MRMGIAGWIEGALKSFWNVEKQIPHPAKGAHRQIRSGQAEIRDHRSGGEEILTHGPTLRLRSGQAGCRRYRVTGFVLAVALLGGTSAVRAQKLQMPPHEKVVLKNGLTVLLLEKRSVPMVSVAGIVKAGGLYDPSGKEGLASATAGLL